MGNDKIYLSKEGYQQFMDELQELRNCLNDNGRNKSDAFVSAVGDGWHDNFAFEDAKREEFRIQELIQQKLEEMNRIVIVDDSNEDLTINVDDYVDLEMTYEGESPEKMVIKLVGSNTPDFKADIPEISLNSPLGKSIHGKKAGEYTFYKVNQTKVDVLINAKAKSIENLKALEEKRDNNER